MFSLDACIYIYIYIYVYTYCLISAAAAQEQTEAEEPPLGILLVGAPGSGKLATGIATVGGRCTVDSAICQGVPPK